MLVLLLLLMAAAASEQTRVGGYCGCQDCLVVDGVRYEAAQGQGDRCGDDGCLMVKGNKEICTCSAPINVTSPETALTEACSPDMLNVLPTAEATELGSGGPGSEVQKISEWQVGHGTKVSTCITVGPLFTATLKAVISLDAIIDTTIESVAKTLAVDVKTAYQSKFNEAISKTRGSHSAGILGFFGIGSNGAYSTSKTHTDKFVNGETGLKKAQEAITTAINEEKQINAKVTAELSITNNRPFRATGCVYIELTQIKFGSKTKTVVNTSPSSLIAADKTGGTNGLVGTDKQLNIVSL